MKDIAVLRSPVAVILTELEAWRLFGGQRRVYVFGCEPLQTTELSTTFLGFHGAGVINHMFIRTPHEAAHWVKTVNSRDGVMRGMKMARGGVALQLYDASSKSIYFMNDPLGAAPIYEFDDGGVKAYSSDLNSLIAALRAINIHATPDAYYFACGDLTGTQAYASDSPFEEIRVLRRGVWAQLHLDGRVNHIGTESRLSIWELQGSYQQRLELMRCEIEENVKHLKYPLMFVCHT